MRYQGNFILFESWKEMDDWISKGEHDPAVHKKESVYGRNIKAIEVFEKHKMIEQKMCEMIRRGRLK